MTGKRFGNLRRIGGRVTGRIGKQGGRRVNLLVMAANGETLRNQDETPDMAAKIERCLQRGRGLAFTRDGVA